MKGVVATGALAAACAVAWWSWVLPVPDLPPAEPVSAAVAAGPAPAPAVPAPFPPDSPPDPPPDRERLVAQVKRLCPWPPDSSSWQVLDAPCQDAADALHMTDEWRYVLDDPLGTRRAVVEALDRPECLVPPTVDAEGNLVWPGEVRADLRETCAAGAMVRLAKLQSLCIELLNMDWDLDSAMRRALDEKSFHKDPDLERYRHRVDSGHRGASWVFWRVYKCRSVPPEAFEWVDALPDPPSDMSVILPIVRTDEEITQRRYLYEAARRLGWEFSDGMLHVLRRFSSTVND